ncbi:hypothetical protein QAD02_002083 [Eretmocerus hayati]|uniref:Uncharacterized protein n=1 Tax=Eretmocerus hayati TaxID=131215 RepID=A0ACC2NHV7_9HYME|nr:hypothetical protein QAD02_002083 [Eretmocerus hayati]
MVASLDANFGQYFSAVSRHSSGEELSNDLALHVGQAILAYRKKNSRLPNPIIIYRDGVGEGQTPFVHDYEVVQIKRKLTEIYGGPDRFRLGFVIVTKRINTRIFYNKKNPPPGTVVDDIITDPLKYDFFLVSQSVRQGTVAPTAYNIIEDNTGLDADKLQKLTYKFCHMYYNFSGTVRVPAPCQYAHKLAFFVSQTLQQTPNPQLQQLLYFL